MCFLVSVFVCFCLLKNFVFLFFLILHVVLFLVSECSDDETEDEEAMTVDLMSPQGEIVWEDTAQVDESEDTEPGPDQEETEVLYLKKFLTFFCVLLFFLFELSSPDVEMPTNFARKRRIEIKQKSLSPPPSK